MLWQLKLALIIKYIIAIDDQIMSITTNSGVFIEVARLSSPPPKSNFTAGQKKSLVF